MEFFTFLIVALVVLSGLAIAATVAAKQQENVQVDLPRSEAMLAVEGMFNRLLWKNVQGRGQLNKQRRMARYDGPVVSVDFESLPSGGTEIQVWMSEATSKFGIVFGAEFAWLQKRKILKRLGAEPVPSIER